MDRMSTNSASSRRRLQTVMALSSWCELADRHYLRTTNHAGLKIRLNLHLNPGRTAPPVSVSFGRVNDSMESGV